MKHIAAFVFCALFSGAVSAQEIEEILFQRLFEAAGRITLGSIEVETAPLVAIYRARGYSPLWITQDGPTQKALVVLDHLKRGRGRGLNPAAYGAGPIEQLLKKGRRADLADVDLLFTQGVARYMSDLQPKRLTTKDGRKSGTKINRPKIGHVIARVTEAPDLDTYLTSLESGSSRYRRLLMALRNYRTIADAGGWQSLPAGRSIGPGDVDPRIGELRRRLAISGDYQGPIDQSDSYDTTLAHAVRRFQRRHGLAEDGVVGPKTLHALNVPARWRVNQIILNLERRRWIPANLGKRYVFVNIADAVVKYVENGRTLLDMRAVVGRPYRRTPVFSAQMTEIRFNPSWYVPARIAREDLLPKIIRDPALLAREGYQVLTGGGPAGRVVDRIGIDWSAFRTKPFPYLLRQAPGPGNALGRVKFLLPNQHNVYLHDTPARRLLTRSARAFSSGCIRLEKPLALATVLLRGQPGWSKAIIDGVIKSAKSMSVRLISPVPVHVTYLTAWVNKDGALHFRDDIYGRDRRLATALALDD